MMMCNLLEPPWVRERVHAAPVHANTQTHFLLYILVPSVPVQSAVGERGFYANERGVVGSKRMRDRTGINLHFMIACDQSDSRHSSSSSLRFFFFCLLLLHLPSLSPLHLSSLFYSFTSFPSHKTLQHLSSRVFLLHVRLKIFHLVLLSLSACSFDLMSRN